MCAARRLILGEKTGMQEYPQLVSKTRITHSPGSIVPPASESSLREAYARLELSRFLTFEQAMSDPAYAIGIRNLADAIARRELTERIADALANHQLSFRLQFTQAFRAELRATISAREKEVADVR
jgi:hypothetical protein